MLFGQLFNVADTKVMTTGCFQIISWICAHRPELLVRLQSGAMTPPRGEEYPSPLATFIVKTFANNSIN